MCVSLRTASSVSFQFHKPHTLSYRLNTIGRITRAIQLGVLVGFVVVAPRFDPESAPTGTIVAMGEFNRSLRC